MLPRVDAATTDRLADLAVSFGSNVQPDQFVDVTYWDPYVKRARLEHAREETLEFVPSWLGDRMLALGEQHCARIFFVPRISPAVLEGVDPSRAGRDQLPDLKER